MTSCWKHVPGKGLLSPWPAACAPFAYTSTVGLYQGQDIGVSGPLIWSGKAVFTFFMVEGIGTARNSYPTPFCKEVSNIHVDFLKSMAVVVDCLSLCWKTYLIPFRARHTLSWEYVLTLTSCDVTNANYLTRFIRLQGRKKAQGRERIRQKTKFAFFASSSTEVTLRESIIELLRMEKTTETS